MSLIKVPQIRPLNDKNGTLYNFTNYNKDFTKGIVNTAKYKRVPSKFVCLKLPNWQALVANVRGLYLDPSSISTQPFSNDPNVLLPVLLQNYIENNLALAAEEDISDDHLTEWALWKLLNNLGAVDLEYNANTGVITDKLTDVPLIQYIGDINLINYTEFGNRAYTELYMHVPHDAKRPVQALWQVKTSSVASSTMSQLPLSDIGGSESVGLEPDANEFTDAVYDVDDNDDSIQKYDYSQAIDKATLDFDNILQSESTDDLEYNCILMYYDTYDVDSDGVKSNMRTKLGSIFVLDNFVFDTPNQQWSIKVDTKFNDATLNSTTGNSNAYRLCTNLFYEGEQATIDVIINQYNTLAMDIYSQALSEMLKTADLYKTQQGALLEMQNEVNSLKLNLDVASNIATLEQNMLLLRQNVETFTQTSSYTVTNQELLDAFAKLSKDFDGLNGQHVTNTFIFNGITQANSSVQFNEPYTYIRSGKTSIRYAEESMLSKGLMRNRITSPYVLTHALNSTSTHIVVKLVSSVAQVRCMSNGVSYAALSNQEIAVPLSINNNSHVTYAIVINKLDGKLYAYNLVDFAYKALIDYTYVGYIITPTLSQYNSDTFTLHAPTHDNSITTDIVVENTIGSYNVGDVIHASTKIEHILAAMFASETGAPQYAPYTQPATNLIVNAIAERPIGYTSLYDIKSQFVQGSAGAQTNVQLSSTNSMFFSIRVDNHIVNNTADGVSVLTIGQDCSVNNTTRQDIINTSYNIELSTAQYGADASTKVLQGNATPATNAIERMITFHMSSTDTAMLLNSQYLQFVSVKPSAAEYMSSNNTLYNALTAHFASNSNIQIVNGATQIAIKQSAFSGVTGMSNGSIWLTVECEFKPGVNFINEFPLVMPMLRPLTENMSNSSDVAVATIVANTAYAAGNIVTYPNGDDIPGSIMAGSVAGTFDIIQRPKPYLSVVPTKYFDNANADYLKHWLNDTNYIGGGRPLNLLYKTVSHYNDATLDAQCNATMYDDAATAIYLWIGAAMLNKESYVAMSVPTSFNNKEYNVFIDNITRQWLSSNVNSAGQLTNSNVYNIGGVEYKTYIFSAHDIVFIEEGLVKGTITNETTSSEKIDAAIQNMFNIN